MFIYKDKSVEFKFNKEKAQIENLSYLGKEYICSKISVFEIAFRNDEGKLIQINADDVHLEFFFEYVNGFCGIYKHDYVRVEIRAEIKEEVKWHINIFNLSKNVIEWVNYPQIIVNNDLKDNNGESKILWGFNEGALIDNMSFRNSAWGYVEPEYPSEGVMGIFPAIIETQCMAYYNNESGLYLASHDKENNLKGIDFYECDNGIKLQFRHFTGCEYGKDYIMPYPMIMTFFKGDWHDAAMIYRTWFEENHSKEFVPINKKENLPQWYSKSPVIVTYPIRGLHDTDEMYPNKMYPYIDAMKHIKKLQTTFNSNIMVILMHWEGTAPWAPPFVWPPYGGEAEFKKFIDALHENENVFGVYCSGLGWTQKSNIADYDMRDFFEEHNLKDEMCLSPEQTLPLGKICPDQRSGYDMCPTRKFTEEVILEQVNKISECGVDYIQLMDQNHGGTSYFCYSKKHDHAPVPGQWQVNAVKNILKKATKDNQGILLGCESAAAESYIPELLFSDNRYNLCYMIGEPVPLYSFVYHKYLNNFMGNQVNTHAAFDHKKSPENIFVRIAYSFCSGDMLTVVLNDDGKFIFNWGYKDMEDLPEQDAIAEFIKNLNYWRQGTSKKYLHTGIMEKPYKIKTDTIMLYGARGFNHEYPKIYTSAWSTEENEFGQFLVNYNQEDVTCVIDLPENHKFVLRENEFEKVSELSGKCEIVIKKLSAVLIEKEN